MAMKRILGGKLFLEIVSRLMSSGANYRISYVL